MKHLFLSYIFTTCFLLLVGEFSWAQTTDTYTLTTSRIASTSAQLNWTGSNLNTTFEVRWRQQGTPDWITTSEITGTTFILTDLLDGQTYEWQLRPAGSAVWQGDPAVFTTLFGCSAPYLYTPYSISVTAATLRWSVYSNVPAPTSFTLEITTADVQSWSAIENLTGFTYTVQNLMPGRDYYWRVRSSCSSFSEKSYFNTPDCTVPKTFAEPVSGAAKLIWSVSKGDATSNLRWRQQGGDWITVHIPNHNSYSLERVYSLTGLTSGGSYDWQVQAVCDNVVSPYTQPQAFTAICPQPQAPTARTIGNNQIMLAWGSPYGSGMFGGLQHQIQFRPQAVPQAPWSVSTVYLSPHYRSPEYGFILVGLTPDKVYEFRVQTICPDATTSFFSDSPVSFTTSGCVSTATSLNSSGSTLTTRQLYWFGSFDNNYAVQFRPTGVTSWSQVSVPSSTANTYFDLKNLIPGTTYEWQVLTYCSLSASAVTPSASQTFTMPICTSTRLNGFSAGVDLTTAQLSWYESSPQSGTYVARYRLVGADTYTTLLPQTSPSVSLSELAENTAYEWQVAVVCSASATSYSFSAPQTFTTVCPNVASYLRTENNQINAINLRWDNQYLNNTYNRTFVVRYRPQGGSYTTEVVSVNTYSPVLSLTGLQTGTVYEWGVARQCSATSNSAYTNGTSFSTTCRNALNYGQTRYVTATRATISFDDSDYRSQYQLRYRAVGAADWLTLPTTSRTYTLTGLIAGTTYEWQAATQCANEFVSTYTASQIFTANCLVPTSPYASAGNSSAYFYWDYNGNVSSYTLQYRLQGTTNWTSISVTNTSYSLNNIQGRYEWRLRAECGNGVSSDFTSVSTFATYCNTPYSLAASALNSYGAAVSWVGSDPSRYNLQWRVSGTLAWNTATDIYQPNYTLSGLTDRTVYEIQVQAQCNNITSNFTSLTVGAVCSVPTGLSSLGFYSYESVPYQDFSWNTTHNVAYNLRWRPITGDNQTPTDWQVASDIQPGSRQFLNTAGTYEWQVQGVCVNGSRSAYVGGKPFVVSDCETKYVTYNRTVVEANQALLYYSAFINADVRWRAVGSPDWNTVANVGVQSGVSIEGLTENTAYEWQVRIQCLSGQIADYGPLQTFTTSCAPPTRLRTICVGVNEASLAWAGPVGDFVYGPYELNWRPVGTTNWSSARVEGYIYSLTGLASGTNYEWRVRAVCSTSANAGFSSSLSFYTQCTQPNTLTAQIQSQCGSATLLWQGGCYRQTSYTVRIRFNYGIWTDYTTTDNAYYLANLPSGTTVEYQVQSNCNGVNSLFSSSYYVYTPSCPAPASCSIVSNLQQQTVSSDQATLTWRTTSSTSELRWRVVGGNWNSVMVSGTNYNLVGLTNNSLYEWKVRSGCAGPNDFSSVSFFRTRCDGTFQVSTLMGGPESISLYVIKPIPYELRYRTGEGAWVNRMVSGNVFTLTGLSANTRYEIQLRNTCSDGSVSDWMPARFMTTTCPVISQVFADRLTETSVRLNWRYSQSPSGLGLVLKYRPLGQTNWTTLSLTANAQLNPATYTLTNLNSQTTYEWLIQFDCGSVGPAPVNNQPLTFRTIGNAPICTGMMTIMNGDWTNPAIWSCGRVPTPSDDVQVLHQVMIPDRGTGRALRVRYSEGGSIRFGTGGRLLLGQ